MKKLTLFLAGFFMFGMVVVAQVTPFTISGKVTNLQSVPAVGWTVYIAADSSQAPYSYYHPVITDSNGNYSLTIQPPSGQLYSFWVLVHDCQYASFYRIVLNDSANVTVNFSICIPVIKVCTASFNYTHSQTNSKRILFYDNSTSNITSWFWKFGDGTTSTSKNPQHTYPNIGHYNARLTVSDGKGCTDSFAGYIVIKNDSSATCSTWFTYTIINRTLSFHAFKNDSTSTAIYNWNFGDGSTATGANPVHMFSTKGNYYVCIDAIIINSQNDTCNPQHCEYIEFCRGRTTWFTFTTNNKTVSFHAFNSDSASTATYNWDFGDGSYGTGANPVHTYDSQYLYYVWCNGLLINTQYDTCASHYSAYVDFRPPNNEIHGRLFGGNYQVDHALVYLIYFDPNDSTLTAIDSVNSWDSTGISTYQFYHMPAGQYLLKAALTSSSTDYVHLMPTYYGNKLFWNQATYMSVTTQSGFSADIYMTSGTNPGGPGFIGGKTSQGANIWATGDPLSNIQVLLLDQSDNPVACQYSKSTGDFGFNNIAYGTYKIYAEVLGKTTFPATVTIDASKPSVDNIKITIGTKEITNSIIDQLSPIVKSVGNVFPNPAYGNVQLEISMIKPCKADIKITNSLGQVVQNYIINLVTGTNFNTINTDNLGNGLYNLKLSFSDGTQIVKPVMLLK